MSDTHTQFVGSIPETYDEHLGPLLFHFYAEDLANRLRISAGGKVLETACGTGIATAFLRKALPDSVEITATDLNEPMLAFARTKHGGLRNAAFEQASALSLPYDDATFDAVVCQFGIMFFPDKLVALKEAARVLRPGGQLLFNVWDSFDRNPIVRIAFDTIAGFFTEDPPTFLAMPFGFYQIDPVKLLLHEAGFVGIDIAVVPTVVERPSAAHAAEGLVAGNPGILEIHARGTATSAQVITAVTDKVIEAFGDNPMRTPLQAIVFSAAR